MNPSGTIYVCRNTNMKYQSEDTIIFSSEAEKQAYFSSKVIRPNGVFSNQMYTRSTTNGVSSTLNGKLYVSPGTSAVKLNCRIQDILDADYMYYIEPSYGNKYFYNFITDVSYISDEVTQVTFAEDVYMTWCNNISIVSSMVERETTSTDDIYEDSHEEVDYQKGTLRTYKTGNLFLNDTTKTYTCIITGVPVVWSETDSEHEIVTYYPLPTGQGDGLWNKFTNAKCNVVYGANEYRVDSLWYYVFDQDDSRTITNAYTYGYRFSSKDVGAGLIHNAEQGDVAGEGYKIISVISIPACALPELARTFLTETAAGFCIFGGDKTIFPTWFETRYPFAKVFNYPLSTTMVDTLSKSEFRSYCFGGYVPNNKKLYSSPYCALRIKNNWGDAIDLSPNWFDSSANSYFGFEIDSPLSVMPEANVYPVDYEGSGTNGKNTSYRLPLPPYPTIPYEVDTVSQWFRQKMISNTLSMGRGVVNLGASIAAGGVPEVVTKDNYADFKKSKAFAKKAEDFADEHGGTEGVEHTLSALNAVKAKGISTGGISANGITPISERTNRPSYEVLSVSKAVAMDLDNLFTMYGYARDEIKAINHLSLNGRTRFYYVKTKECNITGNAPMYAKNHIGDRFNKGIRLWNKNVFLDYSEFNSLA